MELRSGLRIGSLSAIICAEVNALDWSCSLVSDRPIFRVDIFSAEIAFGLEGWPAARAGSSQHEGGRTCMDAGWM
jgi:hypothetical protein